MKTQMFEAPGMPCPRCNFRIKVTLKDLLGAPEIRCPGCLLKLEIDRSQSQESLELAQTLAVTVETLEQVRKMSL